MRFGPREIVFVLLLLAMPLSAYVFVFHPRNEQVAEARQQIELKQARLDRLDQATQGIDDLGQQIDQLEEAIEWFEQKLPAQREVEVMLRSIWDMVESHGLEHGGVRREEVERAAEYAKQPMRVRLRGDFDSFYAFLLDLERLPRITHVELMKLEKKDDEEGVQMEAELLLSIFFDSGDRGRGSE